MLFVDSYAHPVYEEMLVDRTVFYEDNLAPFV